MSDAIRALLRDVKRGLQRIYGPRFRGVYLLGSRARGETDMELDVNVLIVLDRIGRYALEVPRTGELVSTASLAHNLSVSRVFVSEKEWERRDSIFLRNVREEAISA